MLPADFQWLDPVLFFTAVVFVIGLIGNILAFGNRFVNALVTALLVAIVGGALNYYFFGDSAPKTMAAGELVSWLEPVLIAAGVVFVLDFIGNLLSFESRVGNALATALVFAVIFGGLMYFMYNDKSIPTTLPAAPAAAPAAPAPAAAPAAAPSEPAAPAPAAPSEPAAPAAPATP